MDANQQRFWSLADEGRFTLDPATLNWDRARRTLRLASVRQVPDAEDEAAARARVELLRNATDLFGNRAWWVIDDPVSGAGRIVANGVLPSPVDVRAFSLTPSDFAVGHDGVLYVIDGFRVALIDLRDRWEALDGRDDFPTLTRAGMHAWRLAPLPEGGVVVLDRALGQVSRVRGLPLARSGRGPANPGVFRPDPEDPDLPRIDPPRLLPAGFEWVGIATSPAGHVAVLGWRAGQSAVLARLEPGGRPPVVITLADSEFPYSFAWIDDRHVAVMVTGLAEARVYRADAPTDALELPRGDVRPLKRDPAGAALPFAHTLDAPPLYPDDRDRLVRLHRLSLASLAAAGTATNAVPLDAGRPGAVWHRLYLEAAFPRGTGLTVWLAATDAPAAPADPTVWYPHRFGGAPEAGTPQGAWLPAASELPFHPGLLPCDRAPDRAGLFTALIQRRGPHGRHVSTLTGRYLHVRLVLEGDTRSTPEVAALRAYASRFSYVEQYLPALYRERVFGPDADAQNPVTTRADFFERFVGNFEGVLTPLEDRIAAADLLTDPRTVPPASLDWLASWVGFTLDTAVPEGRRRDLLANAMELHRWRGTRRGLDLALDLVTSGGVRDGHVVVMEHWRLRRTLATILGADFADELDPLTGHFAISGNSIVGETLVLGREERREFLALFNAEQITTTTTEDRVIAEFFEQHAHRVTVLVQREQGDDFAGLVRRVVEREVPVHLEVRVVVASHPLVVGLQSLVGVDTYLGRRPQLGHARVDRSRIGERDVVRRPPSLDRRLEGGA